MSSEASVLRKSPLNFLADQSEQRIMSNQYGNKYSFKGTFAETHNTTGSREWANNKINVFQRGHSEMYNRRDSIEDNNEEEDDFRFIEEVVSGLRNDK